MVLSKYKGQIISFLQKYKYVGLVAMVGIALMLIPTSNQKKKNAEKTQTNIPAQSSIQEDLENILSQIDGAGTVRILLKEKTGEETIYQTNEDFSDSGLPGKVATVIVSDSERNECGLIKQINPPLYVGAIVLCQGAEDPSVKFAVADAVSKFTGLGLDKIAVFKMK